MLKVANKVSSFRAGKRENGTRVEWGKDDQVNLRLECAGRWATPTHWRCCSRSRTRCSASTSARATSSSRPCPTRTTGTSSNRHAGSFTAFFTPNTDLFPEHAVLVFLEPLGSKFMSSNSEWRSMMRAREETAVPVKTNDGRRWRPWIALVPGDAAEEEQEQVDGSGAAGAARPAVPPAAAEQRPRLRVLFARTNAGSVTVWFDFLFFGGGANKGRNLFHWIPSLLLVIPPPLFPIYLFYL